MLNISGISKNSASFGNNPRIIVMNTQHKPSAPDWEDVPSTDEYGDVIDITDTNDVANEFSKENVSDPINEKAKYEEQKDFLNNAKRNVEETLTNVEDMVGNSKMGKPIKTAGKIILGAISIAMGFVSMKWATLGTMKVGENIVKSPIAKNIAKEISKPFTAGFGLVSDAMKKGKVGERISGAASNIGERLNDTNAAQRLNQFVDNLKNKDLYKRGAKFVGNTFEKITNFTNAAKERFSKLTGEKVKSAIANFFGVSGGVTAGVETVQAEHAKA